jgi:hypothetical protein
MKRNIINGMFFSLEIKSQDSPRKRKVANSTRTCNLKNFELSTLNLQLYLYAPPKTFFNKSLVRAAKLVRIFTSSLAIRLKSAPVARSVT